MSPSTDAPTQVMAKRAARKGDMMLARVEYAGIRIDIKKRRGTDVLQLETVFYDGDGNRRRMRPSACTDDLILAKQHAEQLALEMAVQRGLTPDIMDRLAVRGADAKVGEMFDLYRGVRLAKMKTSTAYQLNVTLRHAEAIWGRDLAVGDVDQQRLDEYVLGRTRGGYVLPGSKNGQPVTPATNTTLMYSLSRLNTAFRWMASLRHRRRPILPFNPLYGLQWPRRRNEARQPIADEHRFQLLVRHAPEYENFVGKFCAERAALLRGMLPLFLSIARWTGRRRGSIRFLRFRDLLLDPSDLRRALARAGWRHQYWWADLWPCGAIWWDEEWDKPGYTRVVPIPGRLRDLLVRFKSMHYRGDPDAWVFAPHRAHPPTQNVEVKWLDRLEDLVRGHGHDLPDLEQGDFHPYRRLWRSERPAPMFDPRLVALCGGWYDEPAEVMNRGYLQHLPAAMYLCMEYDPGVHLTPDLPVPGVGVPNLASSVYGEGGVAKLIAGTRGGERQR